MMRLTPWSYLLIPMSTIQRLRQNVSYSSAVACASNLELVEVKKKVSRKQSNEEKALKKIRLGLKEDIIKKLAFELDKEQEKDSRSGRMRRALASVANFIRHEDFSNLIEYANGYFKNRDCLLKPDKFEDELCAVILKYASSVHKGDCKCASQAKETNYCTDFFPRFTDSKMDNTFRELANLMQTIPLGDQSKIAFGLCLHWIDEWLRLESNSDVCDEFSPKLLELRRKFTVELLKDSKQPLKNRMLFTDKEYEQACKVANTCQMEWDHKKKNFHKQYSYDLGYSKSLSPFSKGLSHSANESPFVLLEMKKEDYMELFLDQLKSEEKNVIKVVNFSRSSPLSSMEAMIERWGWKTKIRANLEEKRDALGDEELKNFLEHIDLDKCTNQLMDCIFSMVSKAQNVVSLGQFQQQLCRVVLRLVRSEFLASMDLQQDKIYKEMFSKYIAYYMGEPHKANCSIREWWIKCALNCNLDPEFYGTFAKLVASPPDGLGSLLISVILEACKMPRVLSEDATDALCQHSAFLLRDVTYEEESAMQNEITVNIKMLHIRQRLINRIVMHEFENLYFESEALPMNLPPRPWMDHGTCGPLYSHSQNIIRDSIDFKGIFINERFSNRLQQSEGGSVKISKARLVFDSLNILGATPWAINKPMLMNVLKVFESSKDISKKELLKSLKISAHPQTIRVTTKKMNFETEFGLGKKRADVNDADYESFINRQKLFEKEKQEATKKRNELCSLHTWLLYRLTIARHFQDDILYFPHNMDFRGRVYPISPFINHMGDDVNRGFLQFAKGKKLGSRGFDWLKIHCINLTGLMKRQSLKCRLEYADSKISDILDSANNPFEGEGWWQKSDEPWQTLAACIEIRNALESGDPKNFVSHLPIHQDGSCNGLQHYAALGRDYEGAFEVNLCPSDVPMDVYSSVVERVEKIRIEDELDPTREFHEIAVALRKAMPQPMPRKVLKQTVMTTVYGVTQFGAREQIKKQLKSMNIDDKNIKEFSGYLSKNTFDSLDKAFTTSMMLKKWFQRCANNVAKLHQTMEWETPLGMPVSQPYLDAERMFGELYLRPRLSKQVNAFPPNFVHSLDSTHMMLTALFCYHKGLTFAAVHDCFWTHADDVDEMNEICRNQLGFFSIALHEYPIIEKLSEFLIKTYVEDLPITQTEKEVLSRDFIPNVKRGTLDIKDVKNSTYFFS